MNINIITSNFGEYINHDRFVNVSSASTAGIYLVLLLATIALQLMLLYLSGRQGKTGWLQAGGVAMLLCSLLIAGVYVLVSNEETQDVPFYFLWIPAANLLTLLLAGYYRSKSRLLEGLFVITGCAAGLSGAWFNIISNCPYWRDNGHKVAYYATGKKMYERTMNCGQPEGEMKEWYENGVLHAYHKYGKNGRVDSSIEYYEDGKIKSVPAEIPDSGEYRHYLDNSFIDYYRNSYDSAGKKGKVRYTLEIQYSSKDVPWCRMLKNEVTDSIYLLRYYPNGQLNFGGVQAGNALIKNGKQYQYGGIWRKYNSSGKLIDSVNMDNRPGSIPEWWDK
ncbi:MAG: hypothetical protein JSS96_01145 [Bacteroidetes bacterium]|nr:hypothetical protein [Bacteroidota bacterium]